ncbi:MAG TPA: NAD-dependent epimerase/dehydratase family protein [Prolixibacteraceae bacterium]|nr:NAD-dependent epimerase/dehydratase family protein [Prolixibacteraceae bacterium]
MKVLFIGGSGIISSASTELAIEKGIELYHLNRGQSSSIRPVPPGVIPIRADIRNTEETARALAGHSFDVVADWISFVPEQLEQNLKLFEGKTRQYLFISSASAYQTPPQQLPVTEETPLENPFWEYSRNKIACENYLKEEASRYGMKYTLVRPSHTYDKTLLPFDEGYTVVDRMLKGKPVVVLGDGTSIWTLTHHRDFAKGLVGLLGHPRAMDEIFHITSDEWLTWNQIYTLVGKAFGVQPRLVHVPSEVIASYHEALGAGMLGDKSHSMIFDNSKIKSVVPEFRCTIPFAEGVHEIARWYRNNPAWQKTDPEMDRLFDQLAAKIQSIRKI